MGLMRLPSLFFTCCVLASFVMPSWAAHPRKADLKNVGIVGNVKFDYAQVMKVAPVYQTWHASHVEEQCDPLPLTEVAPELDPGHDKHRKISRVMELVKGFFSNHHTEQALPGASTNSQRNCRIVEVPRQFRRPIAYDVDYIYKGTKYRSRLPEDPGNRLPVRVLVTPYLSEHNFPPPR
ncbi:hypothetical protein LZ757_10365 [Xylella fastidiosa subsp. morus]|uniref:Secreted protein n=2 Tax=Xylella fastidiosa TaxID=2371 RepID=A0A9Q4QSZ5_XYLFS|nr:hypothetical protein [Xylella fastidiosa]ERI60566.1 hypothetical protein M233_02950 [Xylella fastidiosa subsp. multiplex Griffin-1]ACA11334.1 conserved hypothetical protein [Xylella fastidiosa M12]KAJ4852493.1 hypothetical protein XYFPCFBP8418_011665 [Xylella fastidiosa subsp. multiplex]MBE0268704.1 hypothetical protein [Xylella fastidiosa subsp. multiplex]MBE0275418.1 hypothetical protein [Xylella fastidiosa subsp. multiplex]